jgi:hypothetical protein
MHFSALKRQKPACVKKVLDIFALFFFAKNSPAKQRHGQAFQEQET